jgi:hypothetical protein
LPGPDGGAKNGPVWDPAFSLVCDGVGVGVNVGVGVDVHVGVGVGVGVGVADGNRRQV